MIGVVRKIVRRFGYDLSPLKKTRDLDRQIVLGCQHHKIELIVDVGANHGQYVDRMRRAGWDAPILSIEPINSLNKKLAERAKRDTQWIVAPAMALSDSNGLGMLECSAETDMSSLLPQTDLLKRLSPSSAVVERSEVRLCRFDQLDLMISANDPRIFLKLDVQGYENTVLDGIGSRWPLIQGIQLEMALLPIYQGEMVWRKLVDRLEQAGFDLSIVLPGYFEPKLARQLQFDGVFFRRQEGQLQ